MPETEEEKKRKYNDINVRLKKDEREALEALQKQKGYKTLSAFIRDIPIMLNEGAFINQLRKVLQEGTTESSNFPITKIKILYYLMTRSAGV